MPPTWQYAAVSRPQGLGRQPCQGKRGVSNTDHRGEKSVSPERAIHFLP